MKYDVAKQSVPTMPTLEQRTKGIIVPLNKASKTMFESIFRHFPPYLANM